MPQRCTCKSYHFQVICFQRSAVDCASTVKLRLSMHELPQSTSCTNLYSACHTALEVMRSLSIKTAEHVNYMLLNIHPGLRCHKHKKSRFPCCMTRHSFMRYTGSNSSMNVKNACLKAARGFYMHQAGSSNLRASLASMQPMTSTDHANADVLQRVCAALQVSGREWMCGHVRQPMQNANSDLLH